VPAVTASMISDKISIDVHEGTGKLIFPRQYSRELVDRVCKEASFDRMGMGYGDAGQALGFLGWESTSAGTLQFTSTDDVVLQPTTRRSVKMRSLASQSERENGPE
jgi:hypothetical protein